MKHAVLMLPVTPRFCQRRSVKRPCTHMPSSLRPMTSSAPSRQVSDLVYGPPTTDGIIGFLRNIHWVSATPCAFLEVCPQHLGCHPWVRPSRDFTRVCKSVTAFMGLEFGTEAAQSSTLSNEASGAQKSPPPGTWAPKSCFCLTSCTKAIWGLRARRQRSPRNGRGSFP